MTDHKYIPGRGPIGAKLMLIVECPTLKDLEANKNFTDTETSRVLQDAGVHKDNCWLTTVSKFHVPPSPSKKKIPFAVRAKMAGIDLSAQLSDLQSEINQLKPNCILAFGGPSLWALTGKIKIEKFRGSIILGMGRKMVASFNPAQLSWQASDVEFVGYLHRQIIIFDIKRALAQSHFEELILPTRNIQICRNSAQLAEFRNQYRNHNKMAVDIEAHGTGLPVCIGMAFNKSHAMVVPLWNADGISTIPTADLVQCWIILAEMLAEKWIIGQNFNYDRDKIKRLGFIIRRLYSDIMLKAQAINPELLKGLAFNTSIYTEEPYYKDEGMYQGSVDDLFMGCGRDSCVTYEVDENMDVDLDEIGQRPFFENFLMELPNLYWGIEQQGFRVDTDERDRLLRKYVEWDEKVRYELFQLVGEPINVNSPKQIGILLFENFKLPVKNGTGEEEITALLNSPTAIKKPEHRRVCELILEGRRVRKSISTYLMALPDYDGRMRTTYFPCLDTGRSSTGQQEPPIRPTVEVIDENGKKKDRVLGTAFQTMTKHGDIGADIRGMYVPDISHIEVIDMVRTVVEEEEIFVQADKSQAEARVVWLLADDEEALRLVDEIDYHAWTATWFFGGVESDYSKKVLGYEHPIRFAGKTLRHAGHLGAGKRRAAISVNTDARKYKIPITITEGIAERALIIFHSKQPKIQQVFQKTVVDCLQRNRVLIAGMPYGMDCDTGGRRTFYDRWGEELNRAAFSYIPQRSISDSTKADGIRIKRRIPRIKIVMEAHDALLFSIPISKKGEYIPIIKEEFERPISFANCSIKRRDLVIPCDIETGSNYRDFKKFKDFPIIMPPSEIPVMPKKSITEEFLVADLPSDSPLTDIIYNDQMSKYDRNQN